MNLGNLAFTDAEVFKALQRSAELVIPGEIDRPAALGLVLNRMLGEKLEKAEEVFRLEHGGSTWFESNCRRDFGDATHTARLVLIEEMK